mgnify:CR=1 FL=1
MSLKIIDRISAQISSYVRGTLTAAFIVGALSIMGLNILCAVTDMQHDYIIIVGIIAGIFNLIPFIGPAMGVIPAIIIYLVTDQAIPIHIIYILLIIAVFAIVQLIDNLVMSPYIMGGSMGIHPMLVIILVLLGASISGILGFVS